MRIAAISDLHMGDGRPWDRFGHSEAEFLEFLHFLEDRHELVVVLGDLYETLQASRIGAYEAEVERCRRAWPRIDERLRGPRYVRLRGNHDEVLGRLERLPDRFRLEVSGVRILFLHGHQFDRVLAWTRPVVLVACWAAAFLARQGSNSLVEALEWADDRLNGVSEDPARCRYQAEALRFAAETDTHVIVLGHTHIAAVTRRLGRVYVNPGACLAGRFGYAHLDPERGDYSTSLWP